MHPDAFYPRPVTPAPTCTKSPDGMHYRTSAKQARCDYCDKPLHASPKQEEKDD